MFRAEEEAKQRKAKSKKQTTSSAHGLALLAARCCLLGFLFDPEGGVSTFLRNVGELLPKRTLLRPRR
jgi:hypothetical protein